MPTNEENKSLQFMVEKAYSQCWGVKGNADLRDEYKEHAKKLDIWHLMFYQGQNKFKWNKKLYIMNNSCRNCKYVTTNSNFTVQQSWEFAKCMASAKGADFWYCSTINPQGQCEVFEPNGNLVNITVPVHYYDKSWFDRIKALFAAIFGI
jgi:hypothetical protein